MKRLGGPTLAAAFALPACTVGPDYTRPVVTTPDEWCEDVAPSFPRRWQVFSGGRIQSQHQAERAQANEERLFSIPSTDDGD